MKIIKGITAVPGLARGNVCLYQDKVEESVPYYSVSAGQVEQEISRFHDAAGRAQDDMRQMVQAAERRLDTKAAEIFNTHLMILSDTALLASVERLIRSRAINAEHAVADVFEPYIRKYGREKGHFK
jgi:phosphotransferase system enzyme I (PtsI)